MEGISDIPSIRRITVVKLDGTEPDAHVAYEKKRKKKKQNRALRPMEKLIRNLARAQITGGQSYLARHKRSNARKKNGWIRDAGKNMRRSQRSAMKVLRKAY